MVTEEGRVLANLATRLLGFRTSSRSCCPMPTIKVVQPDVHAHDTGAGSCCGASAPAASETKTAR